MRSSFILSVAIAVVTMTGCQTQIPKEALLLTQESLEQRQAQTRRFDTSDENAILSASAAVLQDLGFNLDESETRLGVIVASKDRDATEAGQVVGAVVMAVLFGVNMAVDKEQKIRVSLVTRPHGEDGTSVTVRITFQRVVWNTQGQISKTEALTDPALYQEFFSNLSKSIFLEANQI